MSDIDQQFRNSEEHASSITAPPSATIGDRESVMLPPNAGSIVPSSPQLLTAVERLRCSRCQTRMMLERVSPGPIGFERRLFECPKCDHVEISVIASVPFESRAASWLSEQPRAPN